MKRNVSFLSNFIQRKRNFLKNRKSLLNFTMKVLLIDIPYHLFMFLIGKVTCQFPSVNELHTVKSPYNV